MRFLHSSGHPADVDADAAEAHPVRDGDEPANARRRDDHVLGVTITPFLPTAGPPFMM